MGIYHVPKKGYRYDFMVKGERYTEAWFRTKREALDAEAERRKQIQQEAKEQERTATAYEGISLTYLDYAEKRYAKKTYEYKAMVLAKFLAFLQTSGYGTNVPIEQITPQMLHEYLNTRPTTHNYNVHRKELCAFFTYCIKQLRVMSHSPCWSLDKMPEEEVRKEIPTQEEFLRILAAADPKDEKPLLMCLVHTWARIDELLRLRWEDVNFEQRVVMLGTKKRKGGGMQYDPMPMNEDLYQVLWSLWQKREQETWVFFNKKEGTRYNRRPKMMKSICRRAGVREFGFHAIRHFMATYAKDVLKLPLGVISRLLRHKSLKTTEIYFHDMPGFVADAMKMLEGVFSC